MADFKPSQVVADITGNVTIDEVVSNNRPLYTGSVLVSDNVLTTIVTSPANGIEYITKIICSGEDNARWELYLDSVLKATKRTTDRNVEFDFPFPMKKNAAEVLDVKCIFFGSGTTAQCNATIFGYAI